jgi:hypothetical protein
MMNRKFGILLIAVALIWGFFVMALYGDSFMSEGKAELYGAIIFVMPAVGFIRS